MQVNIIYYLSVYMYNVILSILLLEIVKSGVLGNKVVSLILFMYEYSATVLSQLGIEAVSKSSSMHVYLWPCYVAIIISLSFIGTMIVATLDIAISYYVNKT